VGLREDLAAQSGIPREIKDVWGTSIDDLKQSFKMDGATITPISPRASSSGNAQIFKVEGSADVAQIQYSPATTDPLATHQGQYYKITFTDDSQAKIIDPNTYKVQFGGAGNTPTLDKNTIFYNPQGKQINFINGKWVPN
jgi:hypothetical protein